MLKMRLALHLPRIRSTQVIAWNRIPARTREIPKTKIQLL
jgi:hypothetical protein